jgi:hypothetical protein
VKRVGTPTYSETAKTEFQQASKSQKECSSTDVARKDDRAVSIDTRRTKAEKANSARVGERLRSDLHKAKMTNNPKV